MNKSILYIVILVCLHTFVWANTTSDLKIPSHPVNFLDYTIPTKFKKESAVIIAQEFHCVALSSQSYLWMKQKVLKWNFQNIMNINMKLIKIIMIYIHYMMK